MTTEVQNQDVAIAAEAASTEAKHAEIKANFNNRVDVKDIKFNFRKVKDEKTGIESKRPSIELPIPVPSVEGIIEILTNGDSTPEAKKQLDLLLEAVASVVIDQAREIINAKEDISVDNFPYTKLTWETIANIPKAERRGGGIPKETWEDFAKDYIAVMPGVTGKTLEQIETAAKVFLDKLNAAKQNKKVLALLKGQLALYINNTPNAEAFADCVEFLDKKATTLIETDSSSLLEAL